MVDVDGAIRVHPRDWISKYSAAMYNNFWRVRDFGRPTSDGVEPLSNPNLIYAGETLYHIPTYLSSHGTDGASTQTGAAAIPPMPAPPMLEAEKKKITKDALAHEFGLRGEHLEALGKTIDYLGIAENAGSLAEVAGLIAEGGVVSGGLTALSVLNVFLAPIGSTISVINAWETGLKLSGLAAVAYTMTAWAFGDPIPGYPPRLAENMRTGGAAAKIPDDVKAWNESSRATVRSLEEEVKKREAKGISKKAHQNLLQALGDGDRQKLVNRLVDALAKQHGLNRTVEVPVLKTCTEQYPN